jgi:hypothetical protein
MVTDTMVESEISVGQLKGCGWELPYVISPMELPDIYAGRVD